ncbi:MAG TPA: ABC transporter permease [Microbacteriaceae bacterium]|nr:ABC transporter permease [Microbacteriaceae bacterium]
MSDVQQTPPTEEQTPPTAQEQQRGRWRQAIREITLGGPLIGLIAVVLAMLVGSILIAATDPKVAAAAGYFFSRPGDTFAAIWESISGAYTAFFRGAIYNFNRPDFASGIKPLTETLTFATPLIAAGLGVGLTFRAGLFNIGGRGQMLLGAAIGGWIGFAAPLPIVLHPIVVVIVGMAAGAFWAGIAGVLKAYTGAHEVIVTIMLNYVGYYLVFWMLSTKGLLQAPGSNNPKSPPMAETAVFPPLLGDQYNLHAGFLISIAAVVVVWWILERSSLGFSFRAVGLNPRAARTAGIDTKRVTIIAMCMSGALLGLAGVQQVLGTVTTGFSAGIDAGIGFDAITVALLGRSRPWGILAAAILFGAFKAGGYSMQAAEGIQIDIVTVVQALIVLFLAAPPLIRAMFRLPDPSAPRRKAKAVKA